MLTRSHVQSVQALQGQGHLQGPGHAAFPPPTPLEPLWNSRLQLLSQMINRHWDFPDLCSQLHVQDSTAFSPAPLGHTALCSR